MGVRSKEQKKIGEKFSHVFFVSVSIFVTIDVNLIKILSDERQQQPIELVQFYYWDFEIRPRPETEHEPCSVGFIQNHTRESESTLCHHLTYFMLILFLLEFSTASGNVSEASDGFLTSRKTENLFKNLLI